MILSYSCLICAIFATALGQFFYKKYSMTKDKRYFLSTIGLFIVTPIFSFVALQNISIDVVYVFTALTIFIVMVLSKFFLKEQIQPHSYIGVILILTGVVIYGI